MPTARLLRHDGQTEDISVPGLPSEIRPGDLIQIMHLGTATPAIVCDIFWQLANNAYSISPTVDLIDPAKLDQIGDIRRDYLKRFGWL